jgi:FMN phosphatase YigB (HAD superfamily)
VITLFEEIRYIIFDLNGTLVNEDYLKPDVVLEDLLKCQRKGRQMTGQDLQNVARGLIPLSEVIAKLYQVDHPEDISHQYFKIQSSRITFRKKALDVLKILYLKYPLILCSDTTGIAKDVVANLDISSYFAKIFYSCDLGFLKSEKIFWLSLLTHFPKVRPQEFLVIGDNPPADILNPNLLNMHTIMIENPIQLALDYRKESTKSDMEKPNYSIKMLEELLPLLHLNLI